MEGENVRWSEAWKQFIHLEENVAEAEQKAANEKAEAEKQAAVDQASSQVHENDE
jgi:hypothetical protein